MEFGQELLSAGNALFRLAEIVGERKYPHLDWVADRRIERLVAASEYAKGLIYALQRHFQNDPELMSALASVKRITDYLLYSFQSALAYKIPYSEANQFGLSVDLNQIDKRKKCSIAIQGDHPEPATTAFSDLVVNTHRLVSMQMLMVHYFSIEFVVLIAHIHGCRHAPILLDLDSDVKFQELMKKLHVYQQAIRDTLEPLRNGDDFNEQGNTLIAALTGIIDLDLTFFDEAMDNVEIIQHLIARSNDIPLLHRHCVFNAMMLALQTYSENQLTTGKKLFKYTEEMYTVMLSPDQCFPRRFMESNTRDRLNKKFKSFTTTPCNEYQV